MNEKLSFKNNKKVFFLAEGYPPTPSAASVVHRNLLSNFKEDSFHVFSVNHRIDSRKTETMNFRRTIVVFSLIHISMKLHRLFMQLQVYLAVLILYFHIKREKPAALVAAYPDFFFLKIGYLASKLSGIPFFPYLHDTVEEALKHTANAEAGKKLQVDIFRDSATVFVMSEGMKALYKRKNNFETVPLYHIYNETVLTPEPIEKIRREALWGGDVYGMNMCSVRRYSESLKRLNTKFTLTTNRTIPQLKGMGIEGEHIERTFFPLRSDYIQYIRETSLLLLAADWPDESSIDEDELSTIFPTKTVEYLASGRLLVVNAPEHYFITKFIRDNDCGLVIDTRDPAEMDKIMGDALEHPEKYQYKIANALKVVEMFQGHKIAAILKSKIDEVIN